jgi:hypothetical protein
MRALSVVEHYFDFCDVWDTPVNYYFKPESAEKEKLRIENKYIKEKLDIKRHWVSICEIDIIED